MYNAVRLFLDIAEPSLIPTPGTDFTAAVRTSLRAFETEKSAAPGGETPTRALLIVSDGENHTSAMPETERLLREAGVAVYTVGVGETAGSPIPRYTREGLREYKLDREGRIVMTRLEEDVLQSLARNGVYFRIARTSSSLDKLPAALDRLEKTTFDIDRFEAFEERYQWSLILGLLLLLVERLIPEHRRAFRTARADR